MEHCELCHQEIKKPNKYTLSKNLIKILWQVLNLQKGKRFVETEALYKMTDKGSPTAFLTQLKYFGALEQVIDQDDDKVRSGKWKVSQEGELFLLGLGKLPTYVVVLGKRVIESGRLITAKDECLKWKTEDDIWLDLRNFWEEIRK